MNLATAVNIMDHVAANEGEIGFDDDDPTSHWYDAFLYFKRRPKVRRAYQQGLLTVPLDVPRLVDVKPFLGELVAVFNILDRWDHEVAR